MSETVKLEEEDETVTFRETQRVRQRWLWVGLAIVGFFSLFTGLGIFIVLAAAIVIYSIELQTEVHHDGIHLRYGPRHRSFRQIPFADIERCEITEAGGLTHGGPGLLWTPWSSVYSTDWGPGVKIHRKNGKPVTIGTQRPDELMEAITQQT